MQRPSGGDLVLIPLFHPFSSPYLLLTTSKPDGITGMFSGQQFSLLSAGERLSWTLNNI